MLFLLVSGPLAPLPDIPPSHIATPGMVGRVTNAPSREALAFAASVDRVVSPARRLA